MLKSFFLGWVCGGSDGMRDDEVTLMAQVNAILSWLNRAWFCIGDDEVVKKLHTACTGEMKGGNTFFFVSAVLSAFFFFFF